MRKIKDFIAEIFIISLPFAIAYLITGLWLSGITHNTGGTRARMSGHMLIMFNSISVGEPIFFTGYRIELMQFFWVLAIISFSLIVIGKIGYLLIEQFLERRFVKNELTSIE